MNNANNARHLSIEAIAREHGVSLSTIYRIIRGEFKSRTPQHDRLRLVLSNSGYIGGNAALYSPLLLVTTLQQTAHGTQLLNMTRERCESAGIETIIALDNTYVQELARRRVAGIITLLPIDCPASVPCVYVNRRNIEGRHSAVITNHADMVLQMLIFLRKKGFRRLGVSWAHVSESMREQSYLQRGVSDLPTLFRVAGLEYNEKMVFSETITTETHFEVCKRSAEFFAGLPQMPEVVLTDGDVNAYTIVKYLRVLDWRIPEQVRFAACDDSMQWTYGERALWLNIEQGRAPMYIVSTPLADMAAAAVELLQMRIRNPEFPVRNLTFPGTIIEIK